MLNEKGIPGFFLNDNYLICTGLKVCHLPTGRWLPGFVKRATQTSLKVNLAERSTHLCKNDYLLPQYVLYENKLFFCQTWI